MFRTARALVVAALLLMPALAHADMVFSQGFIYAQRYSHSKGPETGYTAGLSLVIDWTLTENKS